MENYKDYGLRGVGSSLQVGKGGGLLVWVNDHFELQDAQGNNLVSLQIADPIQGGDVATKDYVDSQVQGLSVKEPVVAVSNVNVNIAAPISNFDGYTVTEGDRVLLRAQSNPAENGIYDWSASGLVRSTDADNISPNNELRPGTTVLVLKGTQHASDSFAITSPSTGTITLGVDAITWTKISQQKSFVATDGLVMVGNELRVGVDSTTTEIRNDQVSVKSSSLSGQLLLSTGTGVKPVWGPLELDNPNSVTDILPQEHGGLGTNISGEPADRFLLTNGANGVRLLSKGTNDTVLKVRFGALVWDSVNLATDVSGTLTVAQGGTGLTSHPNQSLLVGDGTDLDQLPVGANYTVLRVNNGAVTWGPILLNQTAATSGILPYTRGGTGWGGYADQDILVGNATGGLNKLNKGASGQVLTIGPAGNIIWGGIDLSNSLTTTGVLASTKGGTGRSNYFGGDLLVGATTGGGLNRLPAGLNGKYLQSTGTYLTWGDIDLSDTSSVSGVLDQSRGGTGFTSYAYGDLLYGNSSGDLDKLARGAKNRILIVDNSNTLTWGQLDLANLDYTTNALPGSRGGTGFTSYTQGNLITTNISGQLIKLTPGVNHSVLRVNAGVLEWGKVELADPNAVNGILPFNKGGLGFNLGNQGELVYFTGDNTPGRLAPSDQKSYSETITGVLGKFEVVKNTQLEDVKSRVMKIVGDNGGTIGTVPAYSRITKIKIHVFDPMNDAASGDSWPYPTIAVGDYNDGGLTERLLETGVVDSSYENIWVFELDHLYNTETDIFAHVSGADNGHATVIVEYVRENILSSAY